MVISRHPVTTAKKMIKLNTPDGAQKTTKKVSKFAAAFCVKGYISGMDSDGWNAMQEDVVILANGSVGCPGDADKNIICIEYGDELTSLGSVETAFIEAIRRGNIKLAIAANVYGGCSLQYLVSEEVEEDLLDLIPRDRRSPIYGGVISWNEKLTKKYWKERTLC